MKQQLNIIVDCSGSMNEMEKVHLQKNLCRYAAQIQLIDQEKYSNFVIHFYKWTQNVSEFSMHNDGDLPVLTAEGSASLNFLSDFISNNLNNIKRPIVLILSDGNFSSSDILNFHSQLRLFPGVLIRTVAVGADADLLKLKKISTNNTVYLSENIASAIDSTIFGSDEPLTAPVSTARILKSAPAEAEEPEEDWDA